MIRINNEIQCASGGGLGGTRRGGADVNIKHSGREDNERERERYRLEQRDRDERGRHDRERPGKLSLHFDLGFCVISFMMNLMNEA